VLQNKTSQNENKRREERRRLGMKLRCCRRRCRRKIGILRKKCAERIDGKGNSLKKKRRQNKNRKQTLIATGRNHLRSFASLPTSLIFHFLLSISQFLFIKYQKAQECSDYRWTTRSPKDKFENTILEIRNWIIEVNFVFINLMLS
jgi:hypothetical protein